MVIDFRDFWWQVFILKRVSENWAGQPEMDLWELDQESTFRNN